MLYYLHYLTDWYSPFRIFQYVTVRAVAGAGTAFLISVILGPWVIGQLRRLRMGQYEREEVEQLRKNRDGHPEGQNGAKTPNKAGTPTMGGVLIILSILGSTLLWSVPGNIYVWLVLATMIFMGFVGFTDDYLKVSRKNTKGLSARRKLLLQTGWALLMGGLLVYLPETSDNAKRLMLPFLKNPIIGNIGIVGALVYVTLVTTGAANAVNLTDGLDGLAIGCSGSVAMAYLVMAYVAGHAEFAKYLHIPFISGGAELAVFCGCLLGGALGFLWHNCHPARVFMGDTGSLALGGAMAMVAILIKQELVLIIVGGVFVMEAVSVILQVASFKLTGRRIFAMAPIHHHFEMRNWSETQVTVRFWILSIIFAIIGILTLKIR
ncbi:MAG: phospho-N-acetylmuramoyl-pentapeptide-transferase [Verrucomicrobia bacterium]|nr:phospho-N-acetylmuramoyl-pentapeptide-transferase [Verrucomicrobiota bacterium]